MVGGGGGGARSLQETPTWALATICFVFIFLGLLIEHVIHVVGHWLKKHRKTALSDAVEKLKSVLMLLGFMSLILAVTQKYIAKICVPERVAYSMLPCRKNAPIKTTKAAYLLTTSFHSLAFQGDINNISHPNRLLAESSSSLSDYCASKGKASFMSQQGVTQLSTFICVLAIMQIVYSVVTMALGRAKMRRWKAWEKETQSMEYLVANDPNRFRFTKQTTFGRRHMSDAIELPILLWIRCFFRQFFNSVAKVDYFTLRHGFISAHLSTNSSFNFRKYIQRSLEDDFKVVVGISPLMWLLVVIFLLVDIHGWHSYLWVSFLPLIIVLVIGTKMEVIVAKMALQMKDQHNIIKGAPLVRPNDDLFWFGQPQFILTLLHYILFMNAFELAFFIWVTIQFGIKSCYHESTDIIVTRVVLAVMVQIICSYITLPLYALVTQMGSHFKSAVLEDQTRHVIKQWHAEVKEKRKKEPQYSNGNSVSNGGSNSKTPSSDNSSHHREPSLTQYTSYNATSDIIEEVHPVD